jgi:predicted nucleic acid-binding protein
VILDANILVRVFTADDERKAAAGEAVIRRLQANELAATLPEHHILELIYAKSLSR